VAAKYWALKSSQRTLTSIQNQLNLGRWFYLDQADYARNVICEIAKDLGVAPAYFTRS